MRAMQKLRACTHASVRGSNRSFLDWNLDLKGVCHSSWTNRSQVIYSKTCLGGLTKMARPNVSKTIKSGTFWLDPSQRTNGPPRGYFRLCISLAVFFWWGVPDTIYMNIATGIMCLRHKNAYHHKAICRFPLLCVPFNHHTNFLKLF